MHRHKANLLSPPWIPPEVPPWHVTLLNTLITRGVSLVLIGHGQPGAVTFLKDNPGFPTRICPLPIATQQELEPWDPLPQPCWSVTWLVLVIQLPNSWDPQPCHTALPCTSPSPSSHILCVLYFGDVPWALGMYWKQLANSREMQTNTFVLTENFLGLSKCPFCS